MRRFAILPCAMATASLVYADHINVPGGVDPFHAGQFTTLPFTSSPIPAGFFGSGSDPFVGTITFRGNPMLPLWLPSNANFQSTKFEGAIILGQVPLGPQQAPGADTIIKRTGDASLPPGGSDTVPIELVALNLVSVQPITVTFNGGQNPVPWDVTLDLPNPGTGSMTLNRDGSTNGGTFTSTINVTPRITFVLHGQPTAPECILNTRTDTIDYQGTWNVPTRADIPEPGGWLLAGTGLALLTLRRRLF